MTHPTDELWRWQANIVTTIFACSFYRVSLSQGDSTELFFSHLLAPPAGRVACLTFRYRKYSTGRLMNK